MANELLGTGLSYPLARDASGDLAAARYEESVRQSVWLILATAKGERVMRPTFGCGVHDLVFSPNGAETAAKIKAEVRAALLEWEPRIDVSSIAVTSEGAGETLRISIEYVVRTTNARFNLVYPFYLGRSLA